jgi:hypothetical protein
MEVKGIRNRENMTDLDLLECAQSVYDFLIDDTDIRLNKSFSSFNEIPAFKKMNETLVKYDFVKNSGVGDMILFTLTLNSLYKIYEQNDFRKLMKTSPKDFFSSTTHEFYKTILRDLKLGDLGI